MARSADTRCTHTAAGVLLACTIAGPGGGQKGGRPHRQEAPGPARGHPGAAHGRAGLAGVWGCWDACGAAAVHLTSTEQATAHVKQAAVSLSRVARRHGPSGKGPPPPRAPRPPPPQQAATSAASSPHQLQRRGGTKVSRPVVAGAGALGPLQAGRRRRRRPRCWRCGRRLSSLRSSGGRRCSRRWPAGNSGWRRRAAHCDPFALAALQGLRGCKRCKDLVLVLFAQAHVPWDRVAGKNQSIALHTPCVIPPGADATHVREQQRKEA